MLVSELRSEDEGVIWLGEREEQMAIIHSKRAGIILQGRSLQKWREEMHGENSGGEDRGGKVHLSIPTKLGARG